MEITIREHRLLAQGVEELPVQTSDGECTYFIDREAYLRLAATTPLEQMLHAVFQNIAYARQECAGTILTYLSQPLGPALHRNGTDLLENHPLDLEDAGTDGLAALIRQTLTKQQHQAIPGGRISRDNIDGTTIVEMLHGKAVVTHTGYHFIGNYQNFLGETLGLPNGQDNWRRAGYSGEVNTRTLCSQAGSYDLVKDGDVDSFALVVGAGGDVTLFYDGRAILTAYREELETMAEKRARGPVHSPFQQQQVYRRDQPVQLLSTAA